MKKINGIEIARIVAARNEIPINLTQKIMFDVFEEIREQVRQGNTVMMVGTGTFRQRLVKPGVAVNPKTGQTVPRLASRKIHLVASKVPL